MKNLTITCDRCKQNIKPKILHSPFEQLADALNNAFNKKNIYRIEDVSTGLYLDLCDKCKASFKEWLENAEEVKADE